MQLETFGVFYDLARTRSLAPPPATSASPSRRRDGSSRCWKKLKTELAERRRKKFRLTPDGRVSRRYCAKIARTMCRLDAALQHAHELAANEFHLAVCFSIGFHQLPARLRRFQAAHPRRG